MRTTGLAVRGCGFAICVLEKVVASFIQSRERVWVGSTTLAWSRHVIHLVFFLYELTLDEQGNMISNVLTHLSSSFSSQ